MKTLVITYNALDLLSAIDFSFDDLFSNESAENLDGNVFLRKSSDCTFLLTRMCDPDSPLLIIRQWEGGLFDGVPIDEKRAVFDRCARIALQGFTRAITLNPRWLPYHDGNKISVFAYSYGREERLVAEINSKNTGNVYVFGLEPAQKVLDLSVISPDYEDFDRALGAYAELIVSPLPDRQPRNNGQIELENIDDVGIDTRNLSYEEWVARLSPKQKEFLDRDLSQPIRLRGAAGTGKTVALVLKAIKTRRAATKEKPIKILFLTHSWAMAEKVDQLICELDPEPQHSSILVCPLMTIAQKRDYRAIGREPIGMDSDAGKVKGLVEIKETIESFRRSDWITFKNRCSQAFVQSMEADPESTFARRFQWDVLVEFGCVLSAQGMLGRDDDLEKYLKIRRLQWMMPLEAIEDKRALFGLWKRFLKRLRDKALISTDQIVSDALNDLSTFYWEAARANEGFGAIFVDEMHLFNSQERLVFHHLLNDGDAPPIVLMALDPKQSPREVYTNVLENDGVQANIYDQAKLPNSARIDLTIVYRYSPEIAALVKTIVDAAPGLDLNEDWNVPIAESEAPHGPKPELIIEATVRDTFKSAMSAVDRLRPSVSKRKGRIAVLCLDFENFKAYRVATLGQYEKDSIIISSRDDVEKLRYSQKRFILSMPEYVAGLQFDTVILLDANKNLIPDGAYQGHSIRSFLSELYLGVSRAEKHLLIFACMENGGVTPYLKRAVDQEVLLTKG